MSQKKCPRCGEYVQKNSLTCPRCYAEIPREPPAESPERVANGKKKRVPGDIPAAAVLLAVIPPFFGLLGLGIIYLHPRDSKGYWFLAAGLLLFLSVMALFFLMRNSGFLSALFLLVALVILLIVYISGAAAALLETLFGSVFKILRF
ncbi:MAG: hypothetical protein FWG96_05050 [Methanomassiliicoccaceae archaeon]|nr:hypothetical protein [Methanomassiliicoccaceae archaeon]